jgi:hypothetical protein
MKRLIPPLATLAALLLTAHIDVRLYYSTRRCGLAFSDYMNKKSGDEITNYACYPKARYKVQTRPAGSGKWPSL